MKTSKLQNFKTSKLQNFKILKFLFLFFILLSCSNENTILDDNDNINLTKINNVTKMKNPNTQRIAYEFLTHQEKYKLWHNKIKYGIENSDNFSFNKNQVRLLKKLLNDLNPLYFDKNSDQEHYFKNIYVPNFAKKMTQAFNKKQIFSLFYTPSNYNQNRDFLPKVTTKKNPEDYCDCNLTSIFNCGAGSDCQNDGECQEYRGCGFMWAWECNGICSAFVLTDS